VACNGLKNVYSLANTCQECPKGADCTRGHYDVRPSMHGDNYGIQQGQPFYLTCASHGTLEALGARGVDVAAYNAAALKDNAAQVNMGSDAKVCGAKATLVSTPKEILVNAGMDRKKAVFYDCPNADACSRTLVQMDGSADCAEGFFGPLCALCQVGYAWSEGHKCTVCRGDALGELVGGGVAAGVVFVIAFYAFLLYPVFERDGVGLGTHVRARIAQLADYCRWTTLSKSAQTAANESATMAGGMKGQWRRAMGAMKAAKERLDELKDLSDQLLALFGDGRVASTLRCLVSFTQVRWPTSPSP
jgi:hypothetical protein